MASEQRIETIRSRWREIMPIYSRHAAAPNNGEPSWVCPFCNKGGRGPYREGDGDGLTFIPAGHGESDGNLLICHGEGDSCFRGDIIALIERVEGCNFPQAIEKAEDILRLPHETTLEAHRKPQERTTAVTRVNTAVEANAPQNVSKCVKKRADYADRVKDWQAAMETPAARDAKYYLFSRGMDEDLMKKCGCGYADNYHGVGPAIIIPTSVYPHPEIGYVVRSISPDKKIYQHAKDTGYLFRPNELYEAGPVFVTEGAIDAMSIMMEGYRATAINGANIGNLVSMLQETRPKANIVLCLDTDEAGQKMQAKIAHELGELGIPYDTADISGTFKDPNEAYLNSEGEFRRRLAIKAAQYSDRPDNTTSYIDNLLDADITAFTSGGDRKTGFERLDRRSGGLYNGLYMLAAGSSTGKTTFCLQMADQLAAQGNDVIYFSMEQSKLEMVTKSLARFTAQNDMKTAVTSLDIRKGNRSKAVLEAIERYKQLMGDRVSIVEGDFLQSIDDIQKTVNDYIRKTGKHPVVFIDYLQILTPEAPADDDKWGKWQASRQSTKDIVDSAVTKLKRMTKQLQIPIIAISSINRKSYYSPISMDSLKESGGVEYTADVVWGLQFRCVSSKDPVFTKSDSITQAKKDRLDQESKQPTRELELVCVKNRYGVKSYRCDFDYIPENDLFLSK